MNDTYEKMHPKAKQKWLKALRSGEYCQARRQLVGPDGYCCLGVLCDIVAPSKWKWNESREEWRHGEGGSTFAPNYLIAGVSYVAQERLMDMNDSERRSFAEIADWIEENL